MSATDPPLCRLCQKPHSSRDPHILPANAPAEKRSNRAAKTNGADTNCRTLRTDPRTPEGVPGTGRRGMNGQREVSRQGIVRPTNTSADEAKDRKVGNARRDSSADCSSSRFTAQAGGTPAKNSQLSAKQSSKLIRREGALKYAGGSANAVIAAGALFAPMGESQERTPGANRAQNGVTARRDGKNTRGEGRRVLKAEGVSSDATRTTATAKPNPPTPPAKAETQTKADKVTPGKRKTAPRTKRKAKKKAKRK